MKFNDTTNYEGVIQACERYTGIGKDNISGNSDKLVEFTAYSNTALRKLWSYIFEATGCWEFDDSNNLLHQVSSHRQNCFKQRSSLIICKDKPLFDLGF